MAHPDICLADIQRGLGQLEPADTHFDDDAADILKRVRLDLTVSRHGWPGCKFCTWLHNLKNTKNEKRKGPDCEEAPLPIKRHRPETLRCNHVWMQVKCDTQTCDGCKTPLKNEDVPTKVWHVTCHDCDYDLCIGCAHKKNLFNVEFHGGQFTLKLKQV